MKRILSFMTALVLVLSMVPALGVYAAEPVTVYIDPVNGADTGSGAETAPVKSLEAAYALLQEAGGTLVFLDTLSLTAATVFPACDYPVTVTSKTGAEGITSTGHVSFSGETTLENLTLTLGKASSGTVICGNGYKLTIGENVSCIPFVNADGTYYFCLQGGSASGSVASTDLTVMSGQWRNVYAGGYTRTVSGDVAFTMTGGTAAVVAAGYSGSVKGNITMTVGGTAAITNILYCGSWTTGNVSGNVNVTLEEGASIYRLFCAGNGAGNVTGTVTVTVDGFDYPINILKGKGNTSHTGTLGGSRLVIKSGKLSKDPTDFGAVDIDIPQGKTLTVAGALTIDSLACAGTLNFSGAAALTVASVTGSVNCTVEGNTLKNQVYVTAPAGSAITFPAETGVTEQDGKWVNHDLADFAGLVLASDSANKVNLYGGIWAQGTSTTYTVVAPYATETVDGITYRYYPNAQGGYHVRSSRSGYITLYKNIYMSEEEAATKTVEEIVLAKKGSDGFVPQTVYSHTEEVLENPDAWKSEASMYPKYEDALDIPVFDEGRDSHQMTTQSELEADLAAIDKADDDMYVFSLGKSGEYVLDIPVAIFTQSDLSSASTVEEAAALIDSDKLTVYYRAQMHGNEPGGGEGALAMIHYLQQGYGEQILDKLNLIIVPRLSPDGSQLYQRLLPSTINPNRDQLRLESAEMQALQKGYLLFDPEIVLDGHERVWNNQKGDIQVSASFTPMNSTAFRTVALEMDEAAFAELDANGLNGFYYSAAVNEKDPNMGSSYYAAAGSIYVLMESRGIHGGNESMARRAVAHMAAVTGMLDYLHENDTAVKDMIASEREAIAEKGKTYDTDDVFVLETASRRTTADDLESWGYLTYHAQSVDWATGEVTYPVSYPTVSDVVVRTRTAPTAYVIPAGESWTADVLALMDMHGISYAYLPEGATLPLQRYGGDTTTASLGIETATRFASGCYVFTMNQEKAMVLATLMEPDNTNAIDFNGALAQSGLIPTVNSIYRYIRDLNAEGTVDYTLTDAELVNITVYLDGTNGMDTNNGLSETTAVKTVEQAYAIMDAALSGAEEGSAGTLVIIGLYDLGAQQSHLPEASYSVTITGKTAADGFSFTGGSSQATRTFEIHGETTFQNVTLHINNTQSFNFLLANGHKLVIGEGVNTTTNKTNCYFTLCGGDYDYTDSNASTDITVRSGSWRTIYVGGYRGSVTGPAKADISNCWVYNNIAATYCGNIGSVEMNIADTTVEAQGTSAIYAGPIAYSAGNNVGAVNGDVTLTIGQNVTAQAVYASSRDNGNIAGTATIIADGVDLSKAPVSVLYSKTTGTTAKAILQLNSGSLTEAAATFATGENAYIRLGGDIVENVSLETDTYVDLSGKDITGSVTGQGVLLGFDSANDEYNASACGVVTSCENVQTVVNAPNGNRYIAVTTDSGTSFHRLNMRITSVSLRPSIAGMYYTGSWECDEVLKGQIESFGVVVSLADMPDADFRDEDPETEGVQQDSLWTVFHQSQLVSGQEMTGTMISNILTNAQDPATDGLPANNAERGTAPIYAKAYLTLASGETLVSSDNVRHCLYTMLQGLDDLIEKDPATYADYQKALQAFYDAWKDNGISDWSFKTFGTAAN